MAVGGDHSISSAFPLTPFKDTTDSMQRLMPMSAYRDLANLLNPFVFLGAQGKFLFGYHLQQVRRCKFRLKICPVRYSAVL